MKKDISIDYVPVPLPETGPSIEVAEFTPYKGLEPILDRILSLKTTTGIRATLTFMLMELDSALTAQEAGDPAQAVRHHKSMLDYSKQVFSQKETLAGTSEEAKQQGAQNVQAAAQQIFIDITSAVRGVKNPDGTEKSWGKTLKEIVENFKRAQKAEKNLSLQTGPVTTFFDSPRRELRAARRDDFFDREFNAAAEKQKQPGTTFWVRPEYRNLGLVLEQMATPGQPARVQAMVALSKLRVMNENETAYLANTRAHVKNDGAQQKAYKQARKDLQEFTTRLLKGDKLNDREKAGLARWLKPVTSYASRFERIAQGPGLIAQAFHATAAYLATHLHLKKPEVVKAREVVVPRHF